MEMMDSIWDWAKLLWPVRALLFEVMVILAAMAAHDNSLDLDTEEIIDTTLPEMWQPEMAAQEVVIRD